MGDGDRIRGGGGLASLVVLIACGGDVVPVETSPPCEDCPEPAVVCLEASVPAVDFGAIVLDADPPEAEVALTNLCDQATLIEGLALTGSSSDRRFEIVGLTRPRVLVNPGETLSFGIRARPRDFGTVEDTLQIRSLATVPVVQRVPVTGVVVCERLGEPDSDEDGVPDGCDVCAHGDDRADADADTVPDACDACPGSNDTLDLDLDLVPNGCDACPGADDGLDLDNDGVPDGCDVCSSGDDAADADLDTVPDACDICPGFDDLLDDDGDGLPDAGCDSCPGFDNRIDHDRDGVPTGCDACLGHDDLQDSDGDTVADGCDACPGFDDLVDVDVDDVPDSCDACLGFDDSQDADADDIPDGCDACPLGDDRLDHDLDGIADACDVCPAGDDGLDTDGDTIADACDACPGSDDRVDADLDGVPDACDRCPGRDDLEDSDDDTVADGCDACPGLDDRLDADADTVPDGCDACPAGDDRVDGDGDGIADACDACPGFDDLADRDGDSIADGCDACPDLHDSIDDDGDGVPGGLDGSSQPLPGSCDRCEGFDDALDGDGDTVPDGCDACLGADDRLDGDLDTVPDACEACQGFDDRIDTDGDSVPDGCDRCEGFDDRIDDDGDGVPGGLDDSGGPLSQGCDRCKGFDDTVDVDLDGRPDREPDCDPCVGPTMYETLPPAPLPAKVDVLVVVDDSPSMGEEQLVLSDSMSAFVARLNGYGVDWQAAVISTSSATFRGSVVTDGPDAAAKLASQVSIGVGGATLEEGIARAYEATQLGGDAGPGSNTGFLRNEATLSIVFVSDEPDQSLVAPTQALGWWISLVDDDPSRVVVNAILPLRSPDENYQDLVGLAEGGLIDIDTSSWGARLADLAIQKGPLEFGLAGIPVPGSLSVAAGGAPFVGWGFDRSTSSVFVDRAYRPAPVATLSVTYVEDCEGVFGGCADGLDNDGDGLTDYPEEPGCSTPYDPSEVDALEAPVCLDGIDSDGDGLADHPLDPTCASAAWVSESCLEIDRDRFGYRLCEDADASTACPDLSAGSPILVDDEEAVHVPLGFGFDFYGTEYTSVYVGANGMLNFDEAFSIPHNQCLPVSGVDRSIFVWWDDLSSGSVWTRTSGRAPHRRFEVQWKAPHALAGGALDVRAVLEEGSGDIAICYVDSLVGPGFDAGASATSGIQGSRSSYLEASCLRPRLTEGRVYRFVHP